jgi:hypothetical protein
MPGNSLTRISLDEKRYVPLSSVQSLYDCRAEVITTYTLGTSDACMTRREVYCQSSPSALMTFWPNDLLAFLLTALMIKFAILSAHRGLRALLNDAFEEDSIKRYDITTMVAGA